MRIIKYDLIKDKYKYITILEQYEWRAAKFLAEMLKENCLRDALGDWWELYLLIDGDNLVSFITLSALDCISAPNIRISPWIGFFHTAPEYRGNHNGKKLIDHACLIAKNKGYETVYLATDHIGLYEKYDFIFFENCIDIYGENSRIYKKQLL